jgi:spore coat polysaccharide biosynthesis predicted glycosyltransferase SpsG
MNSPPKTILIRTVGDPQTGMGHVYRSLGLVKELETEFNVLLEINNIPQVRTLVEEQGVRYFVDKDVTGVVESEKVDLLLFDQLRDDDGLFEALKTRFPYLKIVALDYFNYDNEFIDVIINLFNHNLQKSKPDRDGVQYYEGLEYAVIREEFQNYISQTRGIAHRVGSVLVSFGGVDAKGNTRRTLQLLEMAGFPDVKIEVILGPLWTGELPQVLAPNIHLHYSIPPSAMPSFMTEADLAFCGAGVTMMELLSLGTPAIVLPQNQLEERFALSVEQRGAIKVIKGDAQRKDISYICSLFTSPQERERLSCKGKSLVDGKGKERIRNVISHILGKRG